jgi:hypothetical protein
VGREGFEGNNPVFVSVYLKLRPRSFGDKTSIREGRMGYKD